MYFFYFKYKKNFKCKLSCFSKLLVPNTELNYFIFSEFIFYFVFIYKCNNYYGIEIVLIKHTTMFIRKF